MLFVFVSLGLEHGLDLLWCALPLIAVFSPICLCTILLSSYQSFFSNNINTMLHPSFLTWGLSMQCFVMRIRGCSHHGLWNRPLVLLNYVIGRWICPIVNFDHIKKKHKSKPNHACICIRIRKQKMHYVQEARCRCREASHSSCKSLAVYRRRVKGLVSHHPRLICHYSKLGLSYSHSRDPA